MESSKDPDYKCPCGLESSNSRLFWFHTKDCNKATQFLKAHKKLKEIYGRPEEKP